MHVQNLPKLNFWKKLSILISIKTPCVLYKNHTGYSLLLMPDIGEEKFLWPLCLLKTLPKGWCLLVAEKDNAFSLLVLCDGHWILQRVINFLDAKAILETIAYLTRYNPKEKIQILNYTAVRLEVAGYNIEERKETKLNPRFAILGAKHPLKISLVGLLLALLQMLFLDKESDLGLDLRKSLSPYSISSIIWQDSEVRIKGKNLPNELTVKNWQSKKIAENEYLLWH